MSRAREVSKVISTVQLVEDSIDNIDLSSSINTASAAAVAALINGAPAALDTLNELSAALNNDSNFYNTIANVYLTQSSASTSYLTQNLPVIAAKVGAYTITNGDQTDLILLNGTFTVSIPTDSTFNFTIGTQINFLNIGTGQITFAAVTPGTTTVTGTPGLKTRAQWSAVTAIKYAANAWAIIGDLSA